MRPDDVVPDVELLDRFLLGQLSAAEAAPIERYLEQHPEFAATLPDRIEEDTLVSSLHTSARQADDDPPEVAGLIDKLSQLRPSACDTTLNIVAGKRATASGDDTFAGLAPPEGPDEIGRLGGYRVLRLLGAGGMGLVYQAEDMQLLRLVALKVMKPEVSQNSLARERFLREARAAARLKSDHVVTIHHVGEDRNVVFLAMEFLEGMSLEDWLKMGRMANLAQAARIGRQIALGLAAAHERGLLHRDIKPGNIWLESSHQGRVKLLDFGLVRGEAEQVQLTQFGAIVGTPAFMAPEQARGDKVDSRADLFSLGVVLYRLATGQLPFRGDNAMSFLTALALDKPIPPRQLNPDISPRLAELIERLLAKDREQRPKTANGVADELAAIEREASQAAMDAPTLEIATGRCPRTVMPSSKRRTPAVRAWFLAVSLLMVLGGVAALIVLIRDKDGKKIAEISVPPNGTVEIQDRAKEPPAPREAVRIEPEPLLPRKAGEPLSPFALVTKPAKLPGVRGWSIVRRQTGTPSTVAYRPDGKRLAVGDGSGNVHIWETRTWRLERVILVCPGAVSSLAWSPDGRVLAVGTGHFTRCVQLWDADTGRHLRALETPSADFTFALAWSSDGRKLRAWGISERCSTWEVGDGRLLHSVPVPCQCKRPAFSPDGQRLAGIRDGKRITVWDADTGQEMSRLNAPAAVWRLTWSPNGKYLVCTGGDGLHVWDPETGQSVRHSPKAVDRANAPVWSPDGQRLAFSLDHDEGAEVIDVAVAKEPRRLQDGGNSFMAWSPDGTMIVRANGEPWIRLYDAATGKRQFTLTEGNTLLGFAWSPDRQTLAATDRFDTFLVSADTGRVLVEMKLATWPMAWSPDGKYLAARRPDNNTVRLWQADGKLHLTLADYKAEVASLAWSPDGKRLVTTAAGEKSVRIWNAATGERDRELGPFPGVAQEVKWSRDGRLVTFNVPDVGWHIWDVEQGRLVNDPNQWKVYWCELSPDGRSVLTVPGARDVYRLRDLASGKDGARLPFAHSLYQAHPTWSADGHQLAIAVASSIEVWHSDLSKRLRWLGQPGSASQMAFSRDGKLVAGLNEEQLFVWETDTGRQRGILVLGRRNNAWTIAPEGHYTGNENVDSSIVMVVEKEDGTQEILEPVEFKHKYGFKNDRDKVHLLQCLASK